MFQLIQFNPRRLQRRAPAAKVEVDGQWLWMTERDIRANISEFGDHPELQKALTCYRSPSKWYPPEDTPPAFVGGYPEDAADRVVSPAGQLAMTSAIEHAADVQRRAAEQH